MQHIGVISDTHGLLRPQAVAALRGCPADHPCRRCRPPGDTRRAAPHRAGVRRARQCRQRPVGERTCRKARSCRSRIGLLYVLHDIAALELDPPTAGFRAVIFGHSHQPNIETKDGVLYFNPGSAGPRRFSLPVSVGRLTVSGERAGGGDHRARGLSPEHDPEKLQTSADHAQKSSECDPIQPDRSHSSIPASKSGTDPASCGGQTASGSTRCDTADPPAS